jgi:hypothetical protein
MDQAEPIARRAVAGGSSPRPRSTTRTSSPPRVDSRQASVKPSAPAPRAGNRPRAEGTRSMLLPLLAVAGFRGPGQDAYRGAPRRSR